MKPTLNVVSRPSAERPDLLKPRRRATPSVSVGGVMIGSAHPIVVQSMTNTDTADVASTFEQVAHLARAGSQIVRVTVNNEQAAAAVPALVQRLADAGISAPIVGDFHYNGHKLLAAYPQTAAALAKFRINPGNVGTKHRDENFQTIVKVAIEYGKPVRIGVNWGSLDQDLLTQLMEENARAAEPVSARAVTIEAIVRSALQSAELAEATGMAHDAIILSAKTSNVRDLIDVYQIGRAHV